MIAFQKSRFLKYTLAGGTTFTLDLIFLYAFTDILGFEVVLSAAVAFLIATSLNYLFCRYYVFQGTARSFAAGYIGFILIALGGLCIVSGLMHLFVNILAWHYLASRVLVAAFTGLWNYLLNLYVNFRMAGTPQSQGKTL